MKNFQIITSDLVPIGHPNHQLSRDKLIHTKLYPVKREESNMDNNFMYEIDLSENISDQLKKRAMIEKRPKHGRKGSHCGSSNYVHQLHH